MAEVEEPIMKREPLKSKNAHSFLLYTLPYNIVWGRGHPSHTTSEYHMIRMYSTDYWQDLSSEILPVESSEISLAPPLHPCRLHTRALDLSYPVLEVGEL